MYSTWEGLIYRVFKKIKEWFRYTCGFPGGSVVKSPPASAKEEGLISGSGRSPGGGNSPFQDSCLKNPMDKRSLVGYSPRGHKESDTTERLTHGYTWCNFSSVSDISLSAWVLIHFQVHPVWHPQGGVVINNHSNTQDLLELWKHKFPTFQCCKVSINIH